ncbi:MAG TPA: AAA family ATPase, partial [Polyangiaceae bacterium]|nr:AAA family ATPase [Polyangiaceae bacterium]
MTRAAPAQVLEIRLLGEPEVLIDGAPVALPASKKCRALLGYLVRSERALRRERLCELLWDGPDDPRAGLRWSLAKLRPLLDVGGAVRIAADRERVGFESHGALVDVMAVNALSQAGLAAAPTEALQAAVARFRGPFLEGLDLSSCPAFHAWCVAEREALHALHVALLTTLIERLREQPSRAISPTRALIALDPLAESPRLLLIDLLAALGDGRRALEAYDDYARTLRRELGLEPSFELERRRMALSRSGLAAAAPAPPKRAAPEPLAPSKEGEAQPHSEPAAPFVGRERERALLESFLAGAGQGATVLLVLGEPGIGKTRLLEELGRLAAARGGRSLAGRAFEAELVRPYGAFIDALRAAFPEREREPFSSPASDRGRLYDAVVESLASAARERAPLVLVLDDLQWFDEASAELLHYLARALRGSPVLLAASARKGELADNLSAQRLVRALGRERLVTSVELGPLDEAELKALVGALHPRVDWQRVLAEAAGNPLFALEAARALEAGSQDLVGSLGRLIAERLERLEEAERGLLCWAGALGRSFDVGVLARVTGLSAPELLVSLERLEGHAILRSHETGY